MIYLIKCGDYLKIGYANDLNKRLSAYKTHSPKIEVIATRNGNKIIEEFFHKLFKDKIDHGEWMKYEDYIVEQFKSIAIPKYIYSDKKYKNEEPYVRMFMKHMAPYYGLKNNAKNILIWMCNHAMYNTGVVYLTAASRRQMAEDAGICVNTITNNLHTLKKAGLIAGEEGEFIINPLIFWKGDLRTREHLLQDNTLQIQFSLVPINSTEQKENDMI